MSVDHRGVHATHCCPIHGCKYGIFDPEGDDKCPIFNGSVDPEHPENNGCERCEDDRSEYAPANEDW